MSKARSLNKVMLIGNLTRNPVIRETSNNVTVCSFGIATNTSWKDKSGNMKEKAEYHNLIAFNKLAEICAMVLSIGMLVYVEGELRTRVTEGTDGKKIYRTEIKLNDMILIDSKGKKGIGVDAAVEAGKSLPSREVSEEDIDASERNTTPVANNDDEFKSEDLF
ncbi:Single-stranded DNA-binding protein [Patescibacteria group bacterium]|nr:single-stranded DNA-binding protein [Candidatus Dojkabacteria bacterium]CAG1021830.1 Single-stranded DNA-binding protein [Patescibacteria group bacterium]